MLGGASYLQSTPALGRLVAEWSGKPAGCLFLLPATEQFAVWAEFGFDQIVARPVGISPELDRESIECLAEVGHSIRRAP